MLIYVKDLDHFKSLFAKIMHNFYVYFLIKEKKMKKIVKFSFTLLTALVLSACGDNPEAANNTPAPEVNTNDPAADEAKKAERRKS